MVTEGVAPLPRDSHVAVVYGHSMFVFGGSTGSAMDDFHELDLELGQWAPVTRPSSAALARMNRAQSPASLALHRDSTSHAHLVPSAAAPVAVAAAATGVTESEGATERGAGSCSLAFASATSRVCIRTPCTYSEVTHVTHTMQCHVMNVAIGYDGSNRLNDFLRFRFSSVYPDSDTPPSTIVSSVERHALLTGYMNALLTDRMNDVI